jgi:hypothetical protein
VDLQEAHKKIDEIFDMDKSTGDLGKGLSAIKDYLTTLHKDHVEKESLITTLTGEKNELQSQKEKLVLANGELLMKTPVKYDQVQVNNPYMKQEEEEPNGIENLLGRIEIK